MRIRSIAAAVLVAGGLSVALTGAAVAGEPDDDILFVTCEAPDGVRSAPPAGPAPALPAPPEWEPAERGPRVLYTVPPGAEPGEPGAGAVRVAPAEPGEPADTVRVVPAEPGEPGPVECTVVERPHE